MRPPVGDGAKGSICHIKNLGPHWALDVEPLASWQCEPCKQTSVKAVANALRDFKVSLL